MNAREALDVVADAVEQAAPLGTPERDQHVEAVAALTNLVDVAARAALGTIGAWRSALGAALDGEPWPAPGLSAATAACRTTTVPCGFATCEVHYGRGHR